MKYPESTLQQACVKWFDSQYPEYKLLLFSIPNEGARSPANGARMKAMGRRAGVADMFLSMPKYGLYLPACGGLYIEFKAGKGKQTPAQLAFQNAVEEAGYEYVVITSIEQFIEKIREYV